MDALQRGREKFERSRRAILKTMSLQMEDMQCVLSIFRPFPSDGRVRQAYRHSAQSGGFEPAPNYPPYNIERTGENAYQITLAVAGFSQDDLAIETRENTLTVRGRRSRRLPLRNREFLHQGIARAFERRFQLADHVIVTARALRTACCTSISCARFPKPRSRAASTSERPPGPFRSLSKPRPSRRKPRKSVRVESVIGGAPASASFFV